MLCCGDGRIDSFNAFSVVQGSQIIQFFGRSMPPDTPKSLVFGTCMAYHSNNYLFRVLEVFTPPPPQRKKSWLQASFMIVSSTTNLFFVYTFNSIKFINLLILSYQPIWRVSRALWEQKYRTFGHHYLKVIYDKDQKKKQWKCRALKLVKIQTDLLYIYIYILFLFHIYLPKSTSGKLKAPLKLLNFQTQSYLVPTCSLVYCWKSNNDLVFFHRSLQL